MVAIHSLVALTLLCAATVTCRHHARADPPADLAEVAPAPAPEEPHDDHRHRRKRWYSSYGYGQPGSYRDDGPPPPPAPPFDPFAYIYRRLDELTALIRQSPPPPPPIYVPYPVYLPGCSCNPTPGGHTAPAPNATLPQFPNRINTDDDDYDDEPIREISFTPVKPDRPLSRPPPSVEHGSSQAGAQQGREPGPTQGREPSTQAPPAAQAAPSRCDLAVLTCCHQRYATDQCFSRLGCPGALRSGSPCDSRTLANVVSVFQKFYAES